MLYSNNELRDLYLEHLKYKNNSPNTIENYRVVINQMYDLGIKDLENVSWKEIQEIPTRWNESRVEMGMQPYRDDTIAAKMSAIKSFFTFLKKYNYIENNVGEQLFIPKATKGNNEIKTISIKEYRKMLEACSYDRNPERNRLMIEMLFNTGLRLTELIALNVGDVKDNKVVVRHGKGNKRRTVFINDVLQDKIDKYVEKEKKKTVINDNFDKHPLFKSERGMRISASSIQSIVKAAGEYAGRPDIHPHMLRSSYATYLIENDTPIHVVRDLLGHESLDTTLKYVKVMEQHKIDSTKLFLDANDLESTDDNIEKMLENVDKDKLLEFLLKNQK